MSAPSVVRRKQTVFHFLRAARGWGVGGQRCHIPRPALPSSVENVELGESQSLDITGLYK